MRITIVLPYASMSGGIRVPAIYAKHLEEKGHTVTLVSTLQAAPTARERFRMVKRGEFFKPWRGQGETHLDGMGLDWRVVNKQVLTDADVPDADVVIATWWETAYWVDGFSSSKGRKCYFMQDYGAPGQTLEQIVPTWNLGIPMITISDWLENLVRMHSPGAQVHTVHNAVDLDMFSRDRGFEGRECVGVVFNRLPSKRIDLAAQATEYAAEHIDGLELLVIGAPNDSSMLGLGSHGTVLGRLSDRQVREVYNRCRAWLFPSEIEGFGLPILEAMACGTPVIATPAGAACELIARGGGLMTPHGDARAMGERIEQVFSMSKEEWEQMSQAGLKTARSHTWSAAGDEFEALLMSIVEGREIGNHSKDVESGITVG